jgi:hypothetical protein
MEGITDRGFSGLKRPENEGYGDDLSGKCYGNVKFTDLEEPNHEGVARIHDRRTEFGNHGIIHNRMIGQNHYVHGL